MTFHLPCRMATSLLWVALWLFSTVIPLPAQNGPESADLTDEASFHLLREDENLRIPTTHELEDHSYVRPKPSPEEQDGNPDRGTGGTPGGTDKAAESDQKCGSGHETAPPVSPSESDAPGAVPQNQAGWLLVKHLGQDQKSFWTSPLHVRTQDAKQVLPFLAFTAALMASDQWLSEQVPDSPSPMRHSRDFSNYAVISLASAAGGSYLWGRLTNNDHLREAGLLSAEAALDSTVASFALKGLTQRPRPLEGNGSSGFFRGGSSFPSDHSAVAWSLASLLAHEYPGPISKLLAYGLASGITISRVTSQEHFASDAFLGGTLGWYLGRQIYRARHDPELGGSAWGSSAPLSFISEGLSSRSRGSPSVPLDSWIYPAFERLAAWGYLQTHLLGHRPWTRSQCARLVEEAGAAILMDAASGGEAAAIYRSLEAEFLPEQDKLKRGKNLGLRLDSLYLRGTNISGPPLTDGYNFGRTIVNDYGRPFQEGANAYGGLSGYGTAGPLAFYVRAEYQHSPSAPGFPVQVREAVANELEVPVAPYSQFAEMNRPRIVEGYLSLAFQGLQFSFGKQALSWGPSETGSLTWSANAEPVTMFRISSLAPFRLPSLLRWLGPVQTEFFVGQLQGHRFVLEPDGRLVGPTAFTPQPFVHGQKLSFKPTPNLEFGFSRTVTFSGLGRPLTFRTLWNSFSSLGSDYAEPRADAGDRHSGFDLSYRVPRLRKWVTVYTDSFCEDDVLSLSAPQRCAWSPGLYLPQFPGVAKLDFRAEGVFTDTSGFDHSGTYYHNVVYPGGYTNQGNILGNWVGRQGRGVQLWSTYWLSPQSKIQAGYRYQKVDRAFLQGGQLDDVSLRADFALRPDLALAGTVQGEKWNFPLLAAETKSNLAVSLSLTYRPQWGLQ